MSDERGFTLIELMVAVLISSILTGGMLAAMFVGLRTLDDATERIAGANDTQLVAGYFTADIVSSEAISTTGTTRHKAPSVNAVAANSRLVSFWGLNTGTPVTSPAGMTAAWAKQSGDPANPAIDPALQVTSAMADQALTATGASEARFAESAVGTSSLGHSVALSPAALSTISRRGATSFATAAPSAELSMSRPATTQSGDALIAHVTVRGGKTTVSTPNGWTLMQERSSNELRSLLYHRTAVAEDQGPWKWQFNGAREAAGGIADFGGVATVGTPPPSEASPCTGDTPILFLSWTDRKTTVAHEVVYDLRVVGKETHLVRSHCQGESSVPLTTNTLARELAPTASGVAECNPVACGPMSSPVTVTLTLNDPPSMHSTVARTYQLRGSTRVTA